MARRRKTKSKRRSKTGISILGVAETYMLLNVVTETLFNNSPLQFISGASSGAAAGTNNLTLRELMGQYGGAKARVYGPTATGQGHPQTFSGVVGYNLKQNWMTGIAGLVLIPIGFKLGKGVARGAISRSNRLLNKSGIGKTVKL
jgi:hypothetical protein